MREEKLTFKDHKVKLYKTQKESFELGYVRITSNL